MSELMSGLEFARACVNDTLCLTKGNFKDHLEKLEQAFKHLEAANLRVNAEKSFFAKPDLECSGFWILHEGICPVSSEVNAVTNLAPPQTREELRHFIGMIDYCHCNM